MLLSTTLNRRFLCLEEEKKWEKTVLRLIPKVSSRKTITKEVLSFHSTAEHKKNEKTASGLNRKNCTLVLIIETTNICFYHSIIKEQKI